MAESSIEYETKITDLNEDCLINIFKYVHYNDLVNLNEVRSSFHAAIETVISTTKYFTFQPPIKASRENILNAFNQFKDFVQLFGGIINGIEIDLWTMCSRFCTYSTPEMDHFMFLNGEIEQFINELAANNVFIERWTFKGFKLRESLVVSNPTWWHHVKHLKGESSLLPGDASHLSNLQIDILWIFRSLPNLLTLKIIENSSQIVYPDLILQKIAESKLEEIVIITSFRHSIEELPSMAVNSTVKHIEIGFCDYSEQFSALPRYFTKLNTLKYIEVDRAVPTHWPMIFQFPQIKHFGIYYDGSYFNDSEFFAEAARHNKLESLEISFYEFFSKKEDAEPGNAGMEAQEHSIVAEICKMTNLRKLCLLMDFKFKETLHLHQIAQHLINLREFHFYCESLLTNVRMQESILEFVSCATNLTKLCLVVDDWDDLSEPVPFYQKLVNIRRNQENSAVLRVFITVIRRVLGMADSPTTFIFRHDKFVEMIFNKHSNIIRKNCKFFRFFLFTLV